MFIIIGIYINFLSICLISSFGSMLCWELGSPLDIDSAGLGFPVWFGGKHEKTIILRTTRTEYENREDATSFEEYRTSENFNTIPFYNWTFL